MARFDFSPLSALRRWLGQLLDGRRALDGRLRALEDIEAIKQLKHRYLIACDAKDVDGFRDCFAAGAGAVRIAFGRIGDFDDRDALAETFRNLACHPHIVETHHAQNPVIELLGADAARGRWGLHYFMIDARDGRCTQLGGHYDDRYARRDGRWRIIASEFTVTSTHVVESSDAGLRAAFSGVAAPVEIDDPARQADGGAERRPESAASDRASGTAG